MSQAHRHIIETLGQAARSASQWLAHAPEIQINAALISTALALRQNMDVILAANQKDLDVASYKQLAPALIDRLTLTEARIEAMAQGLEDISTLPDPSGKILAAWTRPNGLHIERISVPIGVLGMIYEARPNVTIDAAGLCLKSRNAVILRGGSESMNSSLALFNIMSVVLHEHGLPQGTIGMIDDPDRDLVGEMLRADDYIDVFIPRGGKGLVERVKAEARMPVFSHLDGICHVYVHPSVNMAIASAVVVNAKMRRTGICGAAETLLLDQNLDPALARQIILDLLEAGCTVLGDASVMALDPRVRAATDADWSTEYLDARISARFVSGVEEAVQRINTYGSMHTDSILAEDQLAAEYFLSHVNSAIAMQNASTQFADGGEFGMGAEIGISTGKFHARGPVGVEQLTTYKYIVRGHGQTRA
jgi:glutamate-5-semialdehyde dehydrogenase